MSDPGTTVVRLPNKPKAREEASLWLARLDRGLSEQERQDLGAWLEEDRQHVDALLELAAFWDQTAVLSELAELFPLSRRRRPRLPARAWALAGAALAGAMSVVVAVFYGASLIDPQPDARQVYETTVGGQSTVELLDDGGLVDLPGIRLRIDQDGTVMVSVTRTRSPASNDVDGALPPASTTVS